MCYLSFWDWLISLSIIISSLDHFFFYSWIIFHNVYVPLFKNLVIGQWAFDMVLRLSCCVCCNKHGIVGTYLMQISFLLNVFSGVGWLDHMVDPVLCGIWGNSILCSIMVVLVYIPINNALVPFPPHQCQHWWFLNFSLSWPFLLGLDGIPLWFLFAFPW